MARLAEINQSTGIGLKLFDGATNQFPRARVYNAAGTEQTGAPWNSPIALTHRANGFYSASVTPDAEGEFFVVFRVFSDSGFTTLNRKYEEVMEIVSVRSVDQDLATLTSRLTSQRATNLDNLDATVSSRQAESDALSRYNAVSSAIAAVKDDTADILIDTGTTGVLVATAEKDDIVDRVWDEALAGHNTAGSMGYHQNKIDEIESTVNGISADTNMLLSGHIDELFNVPAIINVPLSGTRTTRLYWRHYDDGVPADPWQDPEIQIELADGAIIVAYTEMVHEGVGIYYYDYVVESTAPKEVQLILRVRHYHTIDSTNYRFNIKTAEQTQAAIIATAVYDRIGAPAGASLSDDLQSGLTALPAGVAEAVWDSEVASHTDVGTFGALLDDTLDAAISSRESEVDAASRASANQSEHDDTQAAIAALNDPTAAQVATAVWDRALSSHTTPGSAGKTLADAAGASPTAIAEAVWDALTSDHTSPDTFGNFISVIRQTVLSSSDDLTSGFEGLAAIKAEVINRAAALTAEINQNETKINQIIPAIDAAKLAVIMEIDQNEILIGGLSTQLTGVQSALKAEIDANEAKLDSLAGAVGAIQNNTTVRFIVPDRLIKPETGSKTYQFHLRLFDDLGNPEAPDSAPTIRIRRLDTGVDIVTNASMSQDGAKVGAYLYNFTITSGTAVYHALVEATVVENGVTRYIPAVTEISEFEADLDAIQTQLSSVDLKVTNTQLELANASYGLSALKTGQTTIINEVNQNETKIDQVKAKTDLIPSDMATEATLSILNTNILARPLISEIQNRLNLIRDNIKGISNRDLSQVYDQIDYSSLLTSNDPRLNNLDAPISSRSVLTAAQVWSFATREITNHSLSSSDVKMIWDYLASQALVPGSLGKRIADFVDASIGTRATAAQVTAALSGVAQETTLLGVKADLTTEANENELKLNSLQTTANAIRAKTDNLPSNPAQQATVLSESTLIKNAIANLDLKATGIKAKTDTIPVNPAREVSVLAIPTNPLLASDSRLTNLDAKISTRSTLAPADLGPLAKTSDVVNARNQLIGEANQNESKLDALLMDMGAVKSKTAALPADPASQSRVASAESAILNAINTIPAGGGLTAAQVWSHPTRALTQDPNLFKADISNLATKADVQGAAKTQYLLQMSTTFDSATGIQEVIAWAEKDGDVVVASNCTVSVVNSMGVLQWTQTQATPNGDKVFRFTHAITPSADRNYYVVITAVVDGQPRTSIEPFVTVG